MNQLITGHHPVHSLDMAWFVRLVLGVIHWLSNFIIDVCSANFELSSGNETEQRVVLVSQLNSHA